MTTIHDNAKVSSTGATIEHLRIDFSWYDRILQTLTSALIAALVVRFLTPNHPPLGLWLGIAVAGQALGFLVVVPMAKVRWSALLGSRRLTWAGLLPAVMLGASMQVELAELALHLRRIWPLDAGAQLRLQQLLRPPNAWQASFALVLLGLLAPALEELLFRGLFFCPEPSSRRQAMRRIAFSALLFGCSHLQPAAVVYASLAGVVLGLVRWWTGSVWLAWATHAAANALPLLLAAMGHRWAWGDAGAAEHVPAAWLWLAGVVSVGSLWSLRRLQMLRL